MFLKQSTASQTRTIGPFVDDSDFKTLENGLTIANTDILLKKNGGASAAKNSGGATADGSGGMYAVTFDATDTATVGEIFGSVKVAGAMVVFFRFTVVEEAVYDALFAASANAWSGAAGSSIAAANVTQISGDSTAADNAESFFDGTGYAGTNNVIPTVTAAGSVTGAVGSVTGNVGGNVAGSVGSVTGAVGSVTGNVGGNVAGSVGSVLGGIDTSAGTVKTLDAAITALATAHGAGSWATATGFSTFNPASDTVARVTLVDTTTTNTDMRGTDSAATAVSLAALVTTVGVAGAGLTGIPKTGYKLASDGLDSVTAWTVDITGSLSGSVGSVTTKTGYALTSDYDFAKGTVAVTESYATDGAAPTPVQSLMMLQQLMTEVTISGTTMTVKKLDGSTTAFTLTLNDATTPTGVTRAS